MFRNIMVPAATAMMLATTAAVAQDTTVRDVGVEVELDAIGNAEAAAYWSGLADDLTTAIVARIAENIADDGVKIDVDIDEVTLANSLQSAIGSEVSRLAGRVNVTHETDNSRFDSYDLAITAQQVGPLLPEGLTLADVTSDSAEFYMALVAAFAEEVVGRL